MPRNTAKPKFLMIIPGRETVPVASFEEASRVYRERCDASGEGASTFPDGVINDYGMNVARISYNGKVWAPQAWKTGDKPLFDPYSAEVVL